MRIFLTLLLVAALTGCENTTDSKMGEMFDSRKSSLKAIAERAKKDGNMQAATKLEAQIIELDHKDVGSFISLGKSLRQMGQQEEAAKLLETGIELNKDNQKGADLLLIELAKTFVEQSDPEAALGRLSLVKEEKNRDYWNTRGVASDMSGKHAEAQDAYREGLKLDGKDALLLNNLALSYMFEKKYKDSITILEGLVKRPDATAKHRQNLALAYGFAEEREKARNMLMKDLSKKEAEENLEFYKQMKSE